MGFQNISQTKLQKYKNKLYKYVESDINYLNKLKNLISKVESKGINTLDFIRIDGSSNNNISNYALRIASSNGLLNTVDFLMTYKNSNGI
jgi:hypothetical protein